MRQLTMRFLGILLLFFFFANLASHAQVVTPFPNSDTQGNKYTPSSSSSKRKEARQKAQEYNEEKQRTKQGKESRKFSRQSQKYQAGYTKTPKERRARWRKFFYPGLYQANTPFQKKMREWKNEKSRTKLKDSDQTSVKKQGASDEPKSTNGDYDSRTRRTPSSVTKTTRKDFTTYKNVKDKDMSDYKDDGSTRRSKGTDENVTNHKQGSYKRRRNVQDKASAFFTGDDDRKSKPNSSDYTKDGKIGDFENKKKQRSASAIFRGNLNVKKKKPHSAVVWKGDHELFLPSDASYYSEYTGTIVQNTKRKRTPSHITFFTGTMYDAEKRDNTEFTLWQGYESGPIGFGVSDYADWEGNEERKGKPGPNESVDAYERDIKMNTNTSWRNTFGNDKRYYGKPKRDEGEKGLWAE